MPFRTIHDVGRGTRRLLAAPKDVPALHAADCRVPQVPPSQGSVRHRELYAAYKEDLAEALDLAEEWWEGIVTSQERAGASPDQALAKAYELVFAGPAARPEVVHVVRKYWLGCDKLNQRVSQNERVAPQVFVLGWLIDEAHDEWVQVLTGMPYWPLGIDEKGEWC